MRERAKSLLILQAESYRLRVDKIIDLFLIYI